MSILKLLAMGGLLLLFLSPVPFVLSIIFAIIAKTKKSLHILIMYGGFMVIMLLLWIFRLGGATPWENIVLMTILNFGMIFYIRKLYSSENKFFNWAMFCTCGTTLFLLFANIFVNLLPLLGLED